MNDIISRALAVVNDQLDALQAVMTEGPIDVVTERYHAWKNATRVALADIVVEPVVARFDLAKGPEDRKDGRRPTPPVFLHGAASRAFLMAIKRDLLNDPAAVLRLASSEQVPTHPSGGIRTVLDLLEHGLGRAFRGRPETERDVQNGFEALLAGAELTYERERVSIVHASRTYVPDFTFPGLQAALGLKLCSGLGREQEIIDEIDHEILAYQTRYPRILFGVFDLGFIHFPKQFCATFDGHFEVWVMVTRPS